MPNHTVSRTTLLRIEASTVFVHREKLQSELNKDDVVPPDLTIDAKRNRQVVFEEDKSGVIREAFDNGGCIAIEAGKAKEKKNKLFHHPLVIVR